jgi:hypothetical protein
MPDIAKHRIAFEKEFLAALGPALHGTGWKKSGSTLFRQSGDFFQSIEISVHLEDANIGVTQFFKPMALDPIVWDILGMSENASKPLSFRARGAFICPGLPIHDELLDWPYSTALDAAVSLSAVVKQNGLLFEDVLKGSDFSTRLAQHPNHLERGAYAVTLVTSLINDGDCEAAAQLASAYASGALSSCINFSSNGISFHRLALDWLDAGKALKRFGR